MICFFKKGVWVLQLHISLGSLPVWSSQYHTAKTWGVTHMSQTHNKRTIHGRCRWKRQSYCRCWTSEEEGILRPNSQTSHFTRSKMGRRVPCGRIFMPYNLAVGLGTITVPCWQAAAGGEEGVAFRSQHPRFVVSTVHWTASCSDGTVPGWDSGLMLGNWWSFNSAFLCWRVWGTPGLKGGFPG